MTNDIDIKNKSLDNIQSDAPYKDLVDRISKRYSEGQTKAFFAINESIVDTNWNIGKYIVEFEQDGQAKAKYGSQLLERLSTDLTHIHGRGFSRSVLNYMRQFYLRYPICETLSHKLSWSHYCELLKISDDLERSFYYQQNINENWSVRELRRQKDTGLFLRPVHNASGMNAIPVAFSRCSKHCRRYNLPLLHLVAVFFFEAIVLAPFVLGLFPKQCRSAGEPIYLRCLSAAILSEIEVETAELPA